MPLHVINVLIFASFYLPVTWIWPWALYLFLFFIGLTFFVSYFFRDPERTVPADPDLIVSAADGIVVTVEEMEEPDFHLGPMIRIAVFLSVFDVHVNRSPVECVVKSTIYRAGKISRCPARGGERAERVPLVVAGDAAGLDRGATDRGADRAADRAVGGGRLGAGPRGAAGDDSLWVAHGGFRAAGKHDSGEAGRPGGGREHADCPLALAALMR